ncbi:unnamed protein product [Adineta steineri]|uniref:U-box domain-containing protein n=1 Tax=Adineta steineri TaxID=433720 RepID=A0A816E9C3_9BILA|nr:unnamed protein product [Adineta steineri]CAF1509760.1 unnamed protein product [Adineta steineri]CAF1646978.1 unnamed protein product [Adineta steineri]CAF1646992.1 unnamed protein product [Adineta steineri]
MTGEYRLTVPRDFLCPITREIMEDPVVLIEDGRSYELYAIERWLRDNNSSPMTNKPLTDRRYIPNFNLKNAIEEFCAQQELVSATNRFLSFNIHYGRIPTEWEEKPMLKIRISLLGGSNVGKTTLARYLQYGEKANFVHLRSTSTIGPDLIFFYLDQLYEDRYVIIIQLTDIPGMERYESCCDNHFRSCHGALLITDSTDIDTLERIELYWYEQLHTKGKEHVETTLVCNKIDLFEENCDDTYRSIYLERAEHFSSSHSMTICHVSALRGDNIQVMFKQLILRILQNKTLLKQITTNNDLIYDTSSTKKDKIQKTSTIQLLNSRASRQIDIGRNSPINCCKYF